MKSTNRKVWETSGQLYNKIKTIIARRTCKVCERIIAYTPEIIKWILGFGSQIEVIERMEMRNEVMKQAEEIKDNDYNYPQ